VAGVGAVWLPPLASVAVLDLILIVTAVVLSRSHRRLVASLHKGTPEA